MSFTLERIIYGTTDSSSEMSILAISDHLTPQDASLWRGITSLRPMDAPSFKASRAFGIFAGPSERFVIACAYLIDKKPFYEYLVLPRDLLTTLAGNLTPLLALFDKPSDAVQHTARIAPAQLNATEPWSAQQRRAQVEALLGRGLDMPQALRLLGAALHERGLMIHDFPPDTDARLTIIEGSDGAAARAGAPRPDLFDQPPRKNHDAGAHRLCAGELPSPGAGSSTGRRKPSRDDEVLASPYIKRLLALWKGDLNAFLNAIDQMGSVAGTLMNNRNLQNSLTVMAERHALDAQIIAGEEVPPEALKTVMRDIPPEGDLQILYARRLLDQALDARDADAALIVARAMDQDPVLDRVIYADLERDLRTRPDAVYSFMRTRLGAGTDLDERWAERLKVAALTSLRVAILDGDAETTINWLRLVAREPASYGLGDVVHYGILAAQERARSEPDLAQALILLAVKRDQAALDLLLADDALLAAVPNGLGSALRSGEGDPAWLLQTYGVEVFLVALSRALDAQCPDLFTAATMEQVWSLYTSGAGTPASIASTSASSTGTYSAEHIIKTLTANNSAWLPTTALEALLGGMLRDKRDDLSHQVIHQASTRADFLTIVVSAISQSERSDSEALALIAQMMAVGDLTQQQAVDVYVGLLNAWDWRASDLGIMEQLARSVQQHSNLEISTEVVWNLLAVAGEMKEAFITRVALRQLTDDLETVEDEALLVEDLQRVLPLVAWDASARAQILAWWRTFVRDQATARLQRIDKALSDGQGQEAKRPLEELRTIVQTMLAFRRMLGKRSFSQFAEDVTTAYALLQGIAESFDPSPKRQAAFDPATIRLEMDARAEELSPHELKNPRQQLQGTGAARFDDGGQPQQSHPYAPGRRCGSPAHDRRNSAAQRRRCAQVDGGLSQRHTGKIRRNDRINSPSQPTVTSLSASSRNSCGNPSPPPPLPRKRREGRKKTPHIL